MLFTYSDAGGDDLHVDRKSYIVKFKLCTDSWIHSCFGTRERCCMATARILRGGSV